MKQKKKSKRMWLKIRLKGGWAMVSSRKTFHYIIIILIFFLSYWRVVVASENP